MAPESIESPFAQFFIVGFSGSEAPRELLPLIDEQNFTSFLLFEQNLRDPHSLSSMIADARTRGKERGLPPLLFSADEEGGLVSPLRRASSRLPSAMALAAGASEDRARRAARAVAIRLRDIGLDLLLAPVLDVNDEPDNPVIGTRSFGDAPDLVASMGAAVLEGYSSGGLVCCVKHFPGHGSTTEDSHKTLPVVTHDYDEIKSTGIAPFVKAFAAGAEAVMTAHVAYPSLDSEGLRPATLSPEILAGLLREKLEFEGTVISDSMEMMGLSGHMPAPEACVEALKAGVDLFICVEPELAVECMRRLRRAYERSDLRDKTLDRAVKNIERLRSLSQTKGVEALGMASPDVETDRESIISECYAESVTLLGCEPQALKEIVRSAKRGVVLLPEGLPKYETTDIVLVERTLSKLGVGNRWRVLRYPFDPAGADLSEIVGQVDPSAGVIFCGLTRGPAPRGQRLLFETLLESRSLLASVALLDPYEIVSGIPEDLPRIATYGYWPECLSALISSLFGGGYATGTLPVRQG